MTGYQGYQGPRGNYGPAGDPGPIGIKGIDGLIGRQGYSGNKGSPGDDGDDGEKKPSYENLQVSNWGWKNMTGFGTNIQQTTGQTINPLDNNFTVKYNYEQNQNKQMKCPPNSYLSGFGYFRKGPAGQDGGWCNEEWETFDIDYDDGKKVSGVVAGHVRGKSGSRAPDLREGDNVEGYRGSGRWYPGKIYRINRDKTCRKGWNRKDNFVGSGPNQWNNARPGMPYSYSSDCAKLM
jgi:hypothetical protein